jgi:hypothetical protein
VTSVRVAALLLGAQSVQPTSVERYRRFFSTNTFGKGRVQNGLTIL